MSQTKKIPPKNINQYILSGELGSGAYATVYKAYNKQNRKMYAVKVFPKSNLKTESEKIHFQHEINTMSIVRHPNIVSSYDFFSDSDFFFLIMDLCKGGSLFDYLISHGKIEEPIAAHIFYQIVDAIHYLHHLGVVHRDLKPENILIDKWPIVKLTDFGICGYFTDNNIMSTFCGSLSYCSPERIAKIDYDGCASDMWSLGIILYILVSGVPPWNTSNTPLMLQQISKCEYQMPDVSEECQDLIRNLLSYDPKMRFTASKVLDHPWMKNADKVNSPSINSPVMKAIMTPPSIPSTSSPFCQHIRRGSVTFKNIRIQNITKQIKSEKSDHGIVSPFEEPQKLENMRRPSLPILKVQALSSYDLDMNQNQKSPQLIHETFSREMSDTYLLH